MTLTQQRYWYVVLEELAPRTTTLREVPVVPWLIPLVMSETREATAEKAAQSVLVVAAVAVEPQPLEVTEL